MRQKILVMTLGISLTMIVLLTSAMFWGNWVSTEANSQRQVESAADDVAIKLRSQVHSGVPLSTADVERVLPAGHRIDLTTADGTTLMAGATGTSGPRSEEEIDGLGTMRLTDRTGTLSTNHFNASITIVGIGLVLALIATLLALRTSRRLTDPIEELAAHAEPGSRSSMRALGSPTRLPTTSSTGTSAGPAAPGLVWRVRRTPQYQSADEFLW